MKEFAEINSSLLRLEETLQRKKKLQKRLFHTRQALKKEQTRLKDLEKRLEKEGDDLKKIEGKSLTALFHSLLGSKDRQVKIERREFLEAKLQRDEAAYSVSEMERDIARIETELNEMTTTEAQYQTLLNQKADLLYQHFPNSAEKLDSLLEEAVEARTLKMEIEEAIAAGNSTREGLDQLIDNLQGAGNWGVVDILGGGWLVTMGKHSQMDQAREKLHYVQQLISQFRRELSDVQTITAGAELQLGEFERFADIFFDGLIVDWVVQSKIEQSLAKAVEARQKIEEILAYLETRLEHTSRQIERLEAGRERLIREV